MAAPPQVLDMAARLGAVCDGHSRRSVFKQTGTLRTDPTGRRRKFSASQWIDSHQTAFCWRARTGPWGSIGVEDSLIDSRPVGSVLALGLIPLGKAKASPELLKGQLMRYLAELPWIPDAIVCNRELSWRVAASDQLSVSTTMDGAYGEVTFTLDSEGLPVLIDGVRPREESGRFVERPWRGQLLDFRLVQGRLIPQKARLSWELDGRQSEVWRGELASWKITTQMQ